MRSTANLIHGLARMNLMKCTHVNFPNTNTSLRQKEGFIPIFGISTDIMRELTKDKILKVKKNVLAKIIY